MPTLGEALTIALTHHQAGRLGLAEEIYRRILAVEPEHPDALHRMGILALQAGEPDAAVEYIERAIRAKEGVPTLHNSQGEAYRALRRTPEAIACYRRALELEPDYAVAHYNLGNALQDQQNLVEAVASYRRAIQRQPELADAHHNLGSALKRQGKLEEAIVCYRRAVELRPDVSQFRSSYLCGLRYHPGCTLAELHAECREYERWHAAPLRAEWRPHENDRDPQRPLALGFVSPRFAHGPLAAFLAPALESLKGFPCRMVFYSDVADPDAGTARFQAVADQWRNVAGMHDEQLAARVRSDRIDILFDLAGHSPNNRLLAFARKPAPIQVAWIDSVGTTGLAAIDYLIADACEVPPGAEVHYTERVLRMPETYVCYGPPRDAPAVGPLPALSNGFVTFASFNNPAKITPRFARLWTRILVEVPASRLVMKYFGLGEEGGRPWRDLFARLGVSPDRLQLEPGSSHQDLLQTYNRVDLALDPFYSGGLTTCESLWMGVPVVTCPGDTFARRHSTSHLSAARFTETIADDDDDYVRIAVGLARDLPRLAQIRAGLRERVAKSPLCDGPRFAVNLMALLRAVWSDWCRAR